MNERERAAWEQFAVNVDWLGKQFLFGGERGYARASAFMEQNRREAKRRQEGDA